MSATSGGFTSAAQTLGPTGPSQPQAPAQSHVRLVQPTQHQEADFRSLYETSQKELADLRGKHGETSRTIELMRKKTDAQEGTLAKLRQAFVPESAPDYKAPDPVQDKVGKLEQELDFYIQKGFEAEKGGSPIPLTIQSAIRDITGQIEYLRESSEQKRTIAELQAKLNQQADPQRQLDGQAYQHIDGFLVRALDTLYGPGDDTLEAKNSQWTAAIQRLKAEVQNLQQNHADVWDKARRSPEKLQRLVNHVVTQNMPPKARQIIETERLRSEPITEKELWTALTEAKRIPDPKKREQTATMIRREIWASKFNKGAGRSQRR